MPGGMQHRSFLRAAGPSLAMALSFAAIALASAQARADGKKVATPCEPDPLHCESTPIAFSQIDALPIEWNFDTGWVPQNSPLQVHIWAGVYADTRLSLAGTYVTDWTADDPGFLRITAPGEKDGGLMFYHYGAELGAQGAVHIKVLGQQFDWVGDLPYVPQFDFQVKAQGAFDSWAFAPGFALEGKTKQQTLAQISIAQIIGASIPGIDGGFELDVAMELKATYTTQKIVVDRHDKPVTGGPILSQDAATGQKYTGGAFLETTVHPEGTVDYDGTLHLIPAFYVKLLGQSWSIPVADVPVSFPISQTSWSFDPVTVHTSLPDLSLPVTEVDFGEVEIGQKNLEPFDLSNVGEAKLAVAMTGGSDLFEIWDPKVEINPGETVQSAFRFTPKQAGEFTATVLLTSNDPDKPLQKILLKGTGVDGPPLKIDTDEPPGKPDVEQPSSCACRAADSNGSPSGLWLFGVALGAAAARSGRRRARRTPS
jgi:hypothetical protein